MKVLLAISFLCIFNRVEAQDPKKEAVGIWTEQHMPSGNYHSPDITLFYYNDSTLTRRLISMSLDKNAPEDNIYKLKTKWQGDTLFYLPPAADWVPQAVFVKGKLYPVFGKVGPLTKAEPGDLNKPDKKFLLKRELYKYDPAVNSNFK